jgi:hypothetical protein
LNDLQTPFVDMVNASSPAGSFTWSGYFPLAGGELFPAVGNSHYASYNTYAISSAGNNEHNAVARIRLYCPTNQPLPDGTIWHGQVRAVGPHDTQTNFVFDHSGCESGIVVGNPTNEDYGQYLPPPDTQFVTIVGHVASPGYIDIVTPFGVRRGMRVDTSEFVEGAVRAGSV